MPSTTTVSGRLELTQPNLYKEIHSAAQGQEPELIEDLVAGVEKLLRAFLTLGFGARQIRPEHLDQAQQELLACPPTEELSGVWFGMENMNTVIRNCVAHVSTDLSQKFARLFLWKVAIAIQLSRGSRKSDFLQRFGLENSKVVAFVL